MPLSGCYAEFSFSVKVLTLETLETAGVWSNIGEVQLGWLNLFLLRKIHHLAVISCASLNLWYDSHFPAVASAVA